MRGLQTCVSLGQSFTLHAAVLDDVDEPAQPKQQCRLSCGRIRTGRCLGHDDSHGPEVRKPLHARGQSLSTSTAGLGALGERVGRLSQASGAVSLDPGGPRCQDSGCQSGCGDPRCLILCWDSTQQVHRGAKYGGGLCPGRPCQGLPPGNCRPTRSRRPVTYAIAGKSWATSDRQPTYCR